MTNSTDQPERTETGRRRARELGIRIGRLEPGPSNAITDVAGVRVGHTTIIEGEGPLVVGKGPIRTGVTVVLPHEGNAGADPVFAGYHVLNGNGEMTGLVWVREGGALTSPVAITNTHSVGVVRDALIAYDIAHGRGGLAHSWSLPVVAETWDGFLSDINGLHVRPEHVFAALDGAAGGPVAEGCVGGGTGMICHGFKGGIGTASRVLAEQAGGWTVGVLVQANHGQRALLRVDGVPVGQEIGPSEVPTPWMPPPTATGSIIVIVATDAPLLPHQCNRLAQRATIGVGRVGGLGENSSGDIFLAFSTANRGLQGQPGADKTVALRALANDALTPLFEAVADATEEAILNAMCVATTTTGIEGRTAYEIPLDRLQEVMRQYRRIV
ncbi:MAG TPA: P1 family peptidase [Herpetosiphonaceae bacterium]|nr:P1 family peptidase [Herpetosiphonaceae bacterium]